MHPLIFDSSTDQCWFHWLPQRDYQHSTLQEGLHCGPHCLGNQLKQILRCGGSVLVYVGVAVHHFDVTYIPDRLSGGGLPSWIYRH